MGKSAKARQLSWRDGLRIERSERGTLRAQIDCDDCDVLAGWAGKFCDEGHQKRHELAQVVTGIEIPWRYAHCELDTLDPARAGSDLEAQGMRRNIEAMYRWCAAPFDSPWLCLAGAAGRGKTHALCAIGKVLADRGIQARYLTSPRLAGDHTNQFGIDRNALEQTLADLFKDNQVVLFDELGWRAHALDVEIYMTLVQRAWDGATPMVWATNYIPELTGSGARSLGRRLNDERLSSRLFSSQVLPMLGLDQRTIR